MVELKFKDIESLNAVTGALRKNGHKYSTFIVWKKGDGGIDCFTVQIEGVENGCWKKEYGDLGIDRGWKCSHCNGSVYEMTYESYQYCPHCGAKMDGDGNG